jgi:hypothetical protein
MLAFDVEVRKQYLDTRTQTYNGCAENEGTDLILNATENEIHSNQEVSDDLRTRYWVSYRTK